MNDQYNYDETMELGGGSGARATATVNDKSRGAWFALSIAVNVALLVLFMFTYNKVELLTYYVMELDGKLMSAGILQYNESWAGKKFNDKHKQEHKP